MSAPASRRHRCRALVGVLLLGVAGIGLGATAPARAQAPTEQDERARTPAAAAAPAPRFELALLGGRRVGGLLRVDTGDEIPLDVADTGALGGRIGWRPGRRVTLQAEYSRQDTTLRRRRAGTAYLPVAAVTIEYLHLGARLRLAEGPVEPYLIGGAGVMRMLSRDTEATDTYPSLAWGAGALLPASSWVALTADLRFLASLLGGGTRVPCQRPAADCWRTGNDTVLLQVQLFGGVTVRF